MAGAADCRLLGRADLRVSAGDCRLTWTVAGRPFLNDRKIYPADILGVDNKFTIDYIRSQLTFIACEILSSQPGSLLWS
jgi:hypothetical protein